MATLPVGATHLLVRLQGSPGPRSVFLALKRPDGSYALNGGSTLQLGPTEVPLPGAVRLRYSGAAAALETLAGRGPLVQPLTLQALLTGDPRGARLRYSFFSPRPPPELPKTEHPDWLQRKAQILEALRKRQWPRTLAG